MKPTSLQVCSIASIAIIAIPHVVMCGWLMSHQMANTCPGYLVVALSEILLLHFASRTAKQFHALNFPLFALSVVLATYTTIANELPGFPIAIVLETTTREEVRGFFDAWQQRRILIMLGVIFVTYVLIGFGLKSAPISLKNAAYFKITIIGVYLTGVIFAIIDPGRFIEGVAASPGVGTAMFVAGPLSSAHVVIYSPLERKRPYGAARTQAIEVHVLIIGESSRRDSWSAYGYTRQTTPYLDKHKDEIVFFSDAVADGNATVYAVPMMLTGISPPEFSFSKFQGNLIDLAGESGYFSIWLANQDPSISFLVGIDANQSFYSVKVSRPGYVVFPPDGILLPALANALTQRNVPLFIVLHTYGSHSPYDHRYPPAFEKFVAKSGIPGNLLNTPSSDQETLDSYDDSILYTDWFIGQIIERVRALKMPSTVTYVSDHGEDLSALDGRSGHGLTSFSSSAFRIPAFVWANDDYRSTHPDKLRSLVANAVNRIRSHDFFYLLADLMGIQWTGSAPQLSPASLQFISDMKDDYIAGGKMVPYGAGKQSVP